MKELSLLKLLPSFLWLPDPLALDLFEVVIPTSSDLHPKGGESGTGTRSL